MRKTTLTATLAAMALGFTVIAAAPAMAQPPHCPPGHAKKGWCSPAPQRDVYRRDRVRERDYREYREYRDYVVIHDYDRYGLRPPRDGYYYGVLDNEVYLVSRATQEIIEAIGAVNYLLSR